MTAQHKPDHLDPKHYRSILEGIHDAVIVTSSEGHVVYMNLAVADLDVLEQLELPTGEALDLQDYILKNVDVRTPEGDRVTRDDRPLMRILRGETFQGVELVVQRRDRDEPRVYVFSGARIDDDPPLSVLTIRDETERWRAERRYRAALDTDPAPGLIARLEDNQILQANTGMAELTELDKDELRHRSLMDLELLEQNEDLKNVREVLQRGERIHKTQTRLLTADGKKIDVLVSARAIEIDGQPSGMFTFIDISDLEAARSETQRMQEELAAEREQQKVQAERARAQSILAEKIEKERVRMAQDLHDGVLQNLLALSAELGLDEQEYRQADNTATAEAIHHYRERVLHNVVQLRRDIRGLRPSPLTALGLWNSLREALPDVYRSGAPSVVLPVGRDPELSQGTLMVLYRVAQEAIQNAVKHAAATRVEVALEIEEGEAILRVTDDGRGFVVPPQLTQLADGDHFGLIGMREHAEAKGGKLEIDSTPGEGTRIVLRLPIETDSDRG